MNIRRYSKHMLRGATSLDSLYETMEKTDPRDEKLKKKEMFIRRIVNLMDTLSLHRKRESSKRFASHLPNNTYFMSFRHYQSKLGIFKNEMNLQFPGDLKGYLHFLAQKYPL